MKQPYSLKKRGKLYYYKLANEKTYHSTGQTSKARAQEFALAKLNQKDEPPPPPTIGEFTTDLFVVEKCQWMERRKKKGKEVTTDMAKMRRGH